MRIVFCIYDWVESKLPLQPWLTIGKVAERLAQRGHAVHVLTDAAEPVRLEGVEAQNIGSLRGSNAAKIETVLAGLRPDALVMLPTPLNIATTSWLGSRSGCRRVGFASYPFYTWRELARAAWRLPWRDVRQYLRHLLIPAPMWRLALRRRLDAMVAQSETTAVRLTTVTGGTLPCHWIQPGIDLREWPLVQQGSDSDRRGGLTLLYLGAATAIRGFDVALEAMTRVDDASVRLRVLARGADRESLKRIRAAVARHGLGDRVDVEGGWIERARLAQAIQNADAVLQPFVLVPSELPVTAMEVIACGTPVIGSAIDGLPSTIGSAGTVVAQGDATALAEAIMRFAQSAQVREAWRAGCLRQREAMLDWGAVTDRWEAVLRG